MKSQKMEPEMLETLHIHSDDVPFVELFPGSGVQTRLLQIRPHEGLVVTQQRAQPGATSPLHRHTQPVFGWTLCGAWGHDGLYSYRPGTYVYETPGVVHQFLNGPDVTEAVFVNTGDIEWIDSETQEVTKVSSAKDTLDRYLEACEIQGIEVRLLF